MRKERRLSQRLGATLRALLCWPLVGVLAVCGIRFAIVSNPGRIGHLAAEVDCFLKERALGLIPDEAPILLLDRNRAANKALLDIYRRHFTVFDQRWQRKLLSELAKFQAVRLPLGRPVLGLGESARYPEVLSLWGDQSPAIELPEEIDAKGKSRLREMGVPDGEWFVCVHVREPGYSPRDDADHNHRNADIGTFDAAIRAITEKGGWVIRVGDPSMTPHQAMPRVVDYAISPLKTDWMDLWLCANNRFFVGTTSGLAMVAAMFGKASALANMIPLGASYGSAPGDISIPKTLNDANGRPLSFSEVFGRNLSRQRYAHIF
ncbi:MAG: TIGR04372 family glycosyltransferase, partial [Pseudomonadota bacterium]